MKILISFFDTSGVARLKREQAESWEKVGHIILEYVRNGNKVTKIEQIK